MQNVPLRKFVFSKTRLFRQFSTIARNISHLREVQIARVSMAAAACREGEKEAFAESPAGLPGCSSGGLFHEQKEDNVTWGRDLPDADLPDFTDEAVLAEWEARFERETLVTHPAGVIFAPTFLDGTELSSWGWLVGVRSAGVPAFGGEEAILVVGCIGCEGQPRAMMTAHRVMYDEADKVLPTVPLGLCVVGVFVRDVLTAAEALESFIPHNTEREVRDEFFGKMAQAFAPRGPEAWNDIIVCCSSRHAERTPEFFWACAVPNADVDCAEAPKFSKQFKCVLEKCAHALASPSPLLGTHIAMRCQISQIEVTVRDVERILVNSDELDRTLLGFNFDHEMACAVDLPGGQTILIDHAGAVGDGRRGDCVPKYSGVFAGGSFAAGNVQEASTSDILGERCWDEENGGGTGETSKIAGIPLLNVTPFVNPPNDYMIKGADGRAIPLGSPLLAHLNLDAIVVVHRRDSIWFAIEMIGISLRSQLRTLFETLRAHTTVERQGALMPYHDVNDDILCGFSGNPFSCRIENVPVDARSLQVKINVNW